MSGTATGIDGERSWSAFLKVLHHPRHWSLIDHIPPAAAAEIREFFPWRDELDAREQVLPALPAGLRVPDEYAVVELGDDRVAWWMEDIDVDDEPWTDEVYARAAHLLGRLAARRTPGSAAGASDLPAGFAVRKVVDSRGPLLAGVLDDDALWGRPVVAAAVDGTFRDDLRRGLGMLPALLDEMDTLPTALPHGDAAPVNLLRPRDEPGTYVAIDWAFRCQLPLGHDLGQLLAGEVERGRMEPDRLPGLLRGRGAGVRRRAGRRGHRRWTSRPCTGGWCAARSGRGRCPGAFPVEHLDGPGDRRAGGVPAAPRRAGAVGAGPGPGAGESVSRRLA